ncbi:Monooxygenase FAD-binding protein [Neofusicoccum parvum]|nr:Monooxygenase FAD-binding protein [Neofusicoccum parvum]
MANNNLKVLIIGAGIGGLTAAIGLRQQGHEVEVFERSRLASEVGAAVHSAPNCTVLLNRLGLFPEEFGGTVYQGIAARDPEAELKLKISVEDEREHWLAQYWLVHRIDLHNALKQKATTEDGAGLPVKLHTGCAVTNVDCATATITLANGTTATGDLVIAADGVHSVTRETVVGGSYPTRSSGKCCYRWLMPYSSLADDPQLRGFAEEPGVMTEISGKDRRIVFYPCSDGQLMNCAGFVPVEEVGRIEKGWHQSGNKAELIRSFSKFSPAVVRMLEKAPDNVAVWDLLDMEVLPTWINGRVALLGDAAHPFLPYMGQGAAQAVEDACTLAALLPLGTTAHDISRRLQLYERCRKERADWVQETTRSRGKDDTRRDMNELATALNRCISFNAWENAISALRTEVGSEAAYHPESRI